MATGTNHNHEPTHQSTQHPEEPTPTDLALIAAQLVRSNGRAVELGDAAYVNTAEVAYALWSACKAVLKSKRAPKISPTEQARQARRGQMQDLGMTEPAKYPVDLKEFLILTGCPGRTHPDRLTKYRAWKRGLGESDDTSEFRTPHDLLAFAGMAVRFGEWLKLQRCEASEPPRTQPEPYLTLRETAKRPGISTATLWRWKIPGHELGGRPRFRISEVEAYLKCEEFKRRVSALRAIRRSRPKQGTPPRRTATARGAKVQRTTLPESRDNDPHGSS